MSQFNKQVLKDSTKDTIVKFTGFIESGSGPVGSHPNTTIFVSKLVGAKDSNGALHVYSNGFITANATLPYYGTTIYYLGWSVGSAQANGSVQLNWRGSNANSLIVNMTPGEWGEIDIPDVVIPYDGLGTANANSGDVFLTSNGIVNGTFTVLVHLRKVGPEWDYGKTLDPGAFER